MVIIKVPADIFQKNALSHKVIFLLILFLNFNSLAALVSTFFSGKDPAVPSQSQSEVTGLLDDND